MAVKTADAAESVKSAAADSIMGEDSSAAEPVPREVCVPEMAAAEMPSPKMAMREMSAAEVPTEMPSPEMAVRKMSAAEVTAVETAEVPSAEMHAAETAASEAAKMAEAAEMAAAKTPEMTTPEMTAAEMAAAKVTAAAKPTVAKGRGFTHRARHYTRRERNFESEPERNRRCENFCQPASHGTLLPTAAEEKTTRKRFRAFHESLTLAKPF